MSFYGEKIQNHNIQVNENNEQFLKNCHNNQCVYTDTTDTLNIYLFVHKLKQSHIQKECDLMSNALG